MLVGLRTNEKGNKNKILLLQEVYRFQKGDFVEMRKTFNNREQRRRELIKVMKQIQDRGWNIGFASSLFFNDCEKNTVKKRQNFGKKDKKRQQA